jgi:hypothetical protein
MSTFLLLLLDATMYLLHGFVLKTLWNWFMVPQFRLPALGIASAIGISIVMSMFTSNTGVKSDEDLSDRAVRVISHNLAHAFIALIAGWITLQFI